MADLFLLSNVAAIGARGGSMQRQAEPPKFKHTEENGKRVGQRESETRSGPFYTVDDVVLLSQGVKSSEQSRLDASALLLPDETEADEENSVESNGPFYSRITDEIGQRQRALLAYSRFTAGGAADGPAPGEDSAEGRAPELNMRPPPVFELVV